MTSTRTITNPRSGQRMIFRKTAEDTNGEYLEIESFHPPHPDGEPKHIHPKQKSSAEVIAGVLHFWVDGKIQKVGPGEEIIIPAGVPHFFWNEGPVEAHSIQRLYPALTMDRFLTSYFALERDGKLNSKGMPPLLIMARMVLKHQNDIRLVKPPWLMQKILFSAVAPIGKILGVPTEYN